MIVSEQIVDGLSKIVSKYLPETKILPYCSRFVVQAALGVSTFFLLMRIFASKKLHLVLGHWLLSYLIATCVVFDLKRQIMQHREEKRSGGKEKERGSTLSFF